MVKYPEAGGRDVPETALVHLKDTNYPFLLSDNGCRCSNRHFHFRRPGMPPFHHLQGVPELSHLLLKGLQAFQIPLTPGNLVTQRCIVFFFF